MESINTPTTSLSLFKESRFGSELVSCSTTVQIEVPPTVTGSSTITTFARGTRSRRRVLKNTPTLKDEEDFARTILASSGSIHFGRRKAYPRSIIWRILRDKKVLELRSADLSKREGEAKEATIILQLIFPSAIRDGCVALVDGEDLNIINLFILTKETDLLTFAIPRDFFCHAVASEDHVSRWCKVFKPVSFAICVPHRLIAENPLQVVMSLNDGRLLHLTREPGNDGSSWRETASNNGKWASLLGGIVRWQGSNTVRYDGTSLDSATATGLSFSPDRQYAYTVCLNHTFKVWKLDTNTSVFSVDLLGEPRDINQIPEVMLDPSIIHRAEVFQVKSALDGEEHYVMTFSPHDLGQFKIWSVRDPNYGSPGIRDMFPEYIFRAPDPDPSPDSKAIWKVADFSVRSAKNGKGAEIWILMRSNKQYRLYNLRFDLQKIKEQWGDHWTMTVLESLDQPSRPCFSDAEPEDVTELWLDLVLHPGRYSETILETALSMYYSARKIDQTFDPKLSFSERLCSAIMSNVRLHRNDADGMDFQKYREDLDQEWWIFWQDVRDLNNMRWSILSLAYDDIADIPWILFTDGYSAIRNCSRLEIMAHNTSEVLAKSMNLLEIPSVENCGDKEPKLPDELALLLEAAATFRQNFDYNLRQTCKKVLDVELWQDSLFSVPIRMQSFYDRLDFDQEIGDAEVEDLEARLGSIEHLETDTFLAIINELPQIMDAKVSGLVSTKLGIKFLVEGVQEMINLHERVLVDLLVLVVFINPETNSEIVKLDTAKVYVVLLEQLKKYQMMQWLLKHTRVRKDEAAMEPTNGSLPDRDNSSGSGQVSPTTVLENLFAVDVKPQSYTDQSQSAALTHSIQDLLTWVTGGNEPTITLDIVLVHIQCNLLANDNIDLAFSFLRYQPSTAWSTYIKGRLYLLKGQHVEAALYFKKAAYRLCEPPLSYPYH